MCPETSRPHQWQHPIGGTLKQTIRVFATLSLRNENLFFFILRKIDLTSLTLQRTLPGMWKQRFLLVRFTGTTNWYSSRTYGSEIQRSCGFWRSLPRLYNGRCLEWGEHHKGPASEHDLLSLSREFYAVSSSCYVAHKWCPCLLLCLCF